MVALGSKSTPAPCSFPTSGDGQAEGLCRALPPHLDIQISSGIQQHLNHSLVPTDAGVHQGGHALQRVKNQRMERVYTVALSLNKWKLSPACR